MAKAKVTSRYVCTECGSISPGWMGRCPACGKFGSITEEIIESEEKQAKVKKNDYQKPIRLSEVAREKLTRINSGIPELDTVLGGGIVPSSLVLIGGDPGIGKSTL